MVKTIKSIQFFNNEQIIFNGDLLKLFLVSAFCTCMSVLVGCSSTQTDAPHTVTILTPDQQRLTGSLVYVVQQGLGKNRVSRLVHSQLNGENAQVLTQVNGTISNVSSSKDGHTIIFTQQEQSFPDIFTYDLTTQQKTLLTPQRANHFSANISPDNQKILLSSSINQNPEIYLADKDGSHLQQLTHNQSVDIAPFWSPDQTWFAFTSDRSGLYHPQLYRYDFATAQTTRIATTGGYNANAKVSPNGDYISYISKQPHDVIQRILKNLNDGKTWSISDDELSESMSFSPNGQFAIYSKKYAIEIAALPSTTNYSQIRPVYQLLINQITLPKSSLSNATIHEPIWLP